MAFNQTQITALESAIAQGVLTVKFNDRLVTYQSLNDMLRARDIMRAELGTSSAGTNGRIQHLTAGSGL